jgi:DNA processing protein
MRQWKGEDEAWLRLGLANIPAGRARAALARWGSPHALLEAAARGRHAELLATPGLSEKAIALLQESAARDIGPALRAIEEDEIWLLREGDALYPPALRAIADAPVMLWVRGTIEPQDEIAIGIVGTRTPTEYGKGMAARIARDLARQGVTVVSGLAMGIDTYAHRGALDGGGRTLACCGCGLDIVYPKPNRELRLEIIEHGAMISEFAPTMHAESWHFPARNRIISGLSVGTVVIEAAEKSGALITADYAVEHGREVFALPGNVLKIQSRGPHGLIRQGATLVEKAEDILATIKSRSLPFDRDAAFTHSATQTPAVPAVPERSTSPLPNTREQNALPFETTGAEDSEGDFELEESVGAELETGEPEPAPALPVRVASKRPSASGEVRADLSADENRIWTALDFEARHIDSIAIEAGMNSGQAQATLLMLELKRLARRLPGGMFERLES